MEQFSKLLTTENSRLAWVLKLGLSGLQTQLQEALKTTEGDAGRETCQELLKQLDILLNQQTASNSTSHQDVLEPVDVELKLQPVAEMLENDPEIAKYLHQDEFRSSKDADLWNEIQRFLLRIPEKSSKLWRDRILKFTTEIGASEDKLPRKVLPFSRSELIYPGLTGTLQTTGLCLSDRIPISTQIITSKTDSDLYFLAGILSTCLKFIQFDSSLHHALKSVDRFGIRPLNSTNERTKYVIALLERFRRVQATAENSNPINTLKARLDFDEAIHSLVYLPSCDRYSWWGKLQQETRRTLDSSVEKARLAGYQVQIRPLWGTYADIYTYSKDDLQLDIGGISGEVSACLRVYAKIDEEILPGRVLFRGITN
jgi:hypothetical protein